MAHYCKARTKRYKISGNWITNAIMPDPEALREHGLYVAIIN